VALKQAKQLLQNINNEKTILLGDFNCGLRTDTDVYEEFISNNYQDPLVQFALEENITWDNQNTLVAKQNFDMPTDRIDQILLPKNSEFKYVSHEIKLKQTYPNIPYNLSDHYAILMEIAYKNIT
jgi:endonuclease/exonuclease/phosphatase family metal-dependent hydrolase